MLKLAIAYAGWAVVHFHVDGGDARMITMSYYEFFSLLIQLCAVWLSILMNSLAALFFSLKEK